MSNTVNNEGDDNDDDTVNDVIATAAISDHLILLYANVTVYANH